MTEAQQIWLDRTMIQLRDSCAMLFTSHQQGKALPFDFVQMLDQLVRDFNRINRQLAEGQIFQTVRQMFTDDIWKSETKQQELPHGD